MQRNFLLWAITCTLLIAHGRATSQTMPPLASYVEKYPHDLVLGVRFRQHPQVVAALAATLPASASDIRRRALTSKNVVDAPIRQLGADRLYARSFDPVSGGEVNWAIVISLDGRQAAVCFSNDAVYGKGRSQWYFRGKEAFSRSGPCPNEKQDIEATLGEWSLGAVPH